MGAEAGVEVLTDSSGRRYGVANLVCKSGNQVVAEFSMGATGLRVVIFHKGTEYRRLPQEVNHLKELLMRHILDFDIAHSAKSRQN